MDQWVPVDTTTQDLSHTTRNFVRVAGDYLENEAPLGRSIITWPQHIDRFERQYNKAFAENTLFGAETIDRTNKMVLIFLQLCNKKCLDNVKMGALL